MRGTIVAKPAAPRRRTRTASGGSKSRRAKSVAVAGVTLTHPDRIYWQDAGITKHMLADYYAEVWDWMRPHAAGRVLALVRCPDGVAGQCFFQKHVSAGIDETHLNIVREPGGDKSIAIDRLDGLIALVQSGALEIHLRGSTIDHLEEADRLVFDLDPGPGVEWKGVIAAAREEYRRQRPPRRGADPLHALGPSQEFLPEHRRADGQGHTWPLHRDAQQGGAEPSDFYRLSAQQPRGHRDRALFDQGAAGRDGRDAVVMGRAGSPEGVEPVHVAKPAEAARPPSSRSVARHEPDQAAAAGCCRRYAKSNLSTRSRSSLANGFCSTGRSR
jgi:hypothetical protein